MNRTPTNKIYSQMVKIRQSIGKSVVMNGIFNLAYLYS